MQQGYFITGTDTDIGKTWCSATLMQYFKGRGQTVVGMKPVASGCHWVDGQLRNQDALILQEHATNFIPYDLVNPYAFEQPVSPHIASIDNGKNIEIPVIKASFDALKDRADIVIVEAVGGWMAPLNSTEDVSDLAVALQLPVILVVGIRLGCINHAKLTYNAIRSKGLVCAGWIASCVIEDMPAKQLNIDTIEENIDAPLIGELPYSKTPDFSRFAKFIDFTISE